MSSLASSRCRISLAFAIASGVRPEQGLYTAVIAGFLISALSGSRFQIGGPTGAFIVIVYDIVQRHGVDGLAMATLLAGLILIVMGIVGLGRVIKFIPYPVTVGFTSGIALIIFVTQVRDLLGLQMTHVPPEFFDKCVEYARSIGTTSGYAAALSAIAIAILVWWPRVSHRVPSPLVALLATTALAHLLGWPVETIGSRFGDVPNRLAAPHLPNVAWADLGPLLRPALAIAILAGIESLLSAVVADGMTGTRHRSNMELVGQGVANVVSPIFGGIPATGAIARTATNIKNGGRTPISGMVHAATLLLIMLFFGKWASACADGEPRRDPRRRCLQHERVAALQEVAACAEVRRRRAGHDVRAHRGRRLDGGNRSGRGHGGAPFHESDGERDGGRLPERGDLGDDEEDVSGTRRVNAEEVPEGVEIFHITGPFFFGAADKFKNAIAQIEKPPRVLVLRMRAVTAIDSTGLHILEEMVKEVKGAGTVVLMSGVRPQPIAAMRKTGLLAMVGEENVCANVDAALARARGMK